MGDYVLPQAFWDVVVNCHPFVIQIQFTSHSEYSFRYLQYSTMHPEMQDGPLGALLRHMAQAETVTVECQCGAEVQMNKAYSKYVTGKLSSCRFCRNERSE